MTDIQDPKQIPILAYALTQGELCVNKCDYINPNLGWCTIFDNPLHSASYNNIEVRWFRCKECLANEINNEIKTQSPPRKSDCIEYHKDVPYFHADPDNPSLIIKTLNGVETRGTFDLDGNWVESQ